MAGRRAAARLTRLLGGQVGPDGLVAPGKGPPVAGGHRIGGRSGTEVHQRRGLRRRGPPRIAGDDGSFVRAVVRPGPAVLAATVALVSVPVGAPLALSLALVPAIIGLTTAPGVARARTVRAEAREAEALAAQRFAVERARRAQRVAARTSRWDALQNDARSAADRLAAAIDRCPPGPRRDHLRSTAPDVTRARRRLEELVELGRALDEAIEGVPPPAKAHPRQRDRRPRKRRAATPAGPGPARLRNRRDDVEAEVRQIDASLRAAADLALEVATDVLVDDTGDRIADLVLELEALRAALEELHATPSAG